MSTLKKIGSVLGGLGTAYLAGAYAPFGLLGSLAVGAVAGTAGAGIGGGSMNTAKKAWDTHIGRKGLIGEGGEMLGLWESGTTADRKRGLLKALDKDIANINENNATTKKLALNRFNSVNLNENKKTGGILGSINMSSNLAGDSSRYMRGKEAIQNAINKSNINYQDTITRNLERDAQASDRVMSLETRKEQIRNS